MSENPERIKRAPDGRLTGVSILGWALDEEENVAEYIRRVEEFAARIAVKFELILVDDGSTDRTAQIVTAAAATRPWLRFVQNDRNHGPAFNAKLGISLATMDYLFWQTVDWSYDISQMPEALRYLDEFDVLQGVREGTVSWRGLLFRRSDNPFKGVVSLSNYLLVRVLFGLPFHDFQNVTLYPRRLIQSVSLEADSAFINPECLLKTWWSGASFQEFPVPFIARTRGRAKGTRPRDIFNAVRDVLGYWWRWSIRGSTATKRGRMVTWADRVRA